MLGCGNRSPRELQVQTSLRIFWNRTCGVFQGGAGVARAWRGRGAAYRLRLSMNGAGVARAWRGH
eukprot:gene13548-biopygen507